MCPQHHHFSSRIIFISLLLLMLFMGFQLWMWSRSIRSEHEIELAHNHVQKIQFQKPPLFAGVSLPPETYNCIESDVAGVDLWGAAEEENRRYFLLGLYQVFSSAINPLTPVTVQEGLIQLGKAGCQRLVGLNSTQKPLSLYVSKKTALDLENQRFRRFIKLLGGSPQQLKKALVAYRQDYRLSDEALDALKTLNIKVEDYQGLSVNTFN